MTHRVLQNCTNMKSREHIQLDNPNPFRYEIEAFIVLHVGTYVSSAYKWNPYDVDKSDLVLSNGLFVNMFFIWLIRSAEDLRCLQLLL